MDIEKLLKPHDTVDPVRANRVIENINARLQAIGEELKAPDLRRSQCLPMQRSSLGGRALKHVLKPLSAARIARYGFLSNKGAAVTSAIPGFGLVAGTIVLSVDGQRVTDPVMLLSYVEAKPEASDVVVCVLRESPSGRARGGKQPQISGAARGFRCRARGMADRARRLEHQPDQPRVIFKRKGENLERLYSRGPLPCQPD